MRAIIANEEAAIRDRHRKGEVLRFKIFIVLHLLQLI